MGKDPANRDRRETNCQTRKKYIALNDVQMFFVRKTRTSGEGLPESTHCI